MLGESQDHVNRNLLTLIHTLLYTDYLYTMVFDNFTFEYNF